MNYANQDSYDGEWKEDLKDGKGAMNYNNGDVYKGPFSNDEMHGKGTFEYAAGDVLKSVGEWNEGKKFGLFQDTVRVDKQVYYDNDEVKEAISNLKREASSDGDTDTDDAPPSKRRNVSASPP